jgi:hypothetical protein
MISAVDGLNVPVCQRDLKTLAEIVQLIRPDEATRKCERRPSSTKGFSTFIVLGGAKLLAAWRRSCSDGSMPFRAPQADLDPPIFDSE